MAYYLKAYNISECFLTTPVAVTGTSGSRNWRYLFTLNIVTNDFVIGGRDSNSSNIFFAKKSAFELRNSQGTNINRTYGSTQSDVHTVEVIGLNNQTFVQLDGTLLAPSVNGDDIFDLETLFAFDAGRSADIYRIQFYENNVLVHDWDPTASNGTGSILVDRIAANNVILGNGFPTDGSQWEYYDDGGVITAAGDITLPSLVFAGTATDTTSEITAAGDITLPSLVFAGNATDTTSEITVAGDITLPSLVLAGSATDTTSEITAAGNITLPSLVFAGTATDTTSEITAAGDITLPSLVFAGTGAITETSEVTAAGDITLPSLVFAGSATDTTSEVTAAGDITLPSLVFAGNATAGQVISDFTIQIDNTAKIIETTPNSYTIRI